MKHRLLICASLVIAVAAGSVDLGACGDKFFRPGRGVRNKSYVAIHPASVLLYAPKGTSAKTLKAFEEALRQAGHSPRSVQGMDGLTAALASGRADIVIVAASEAAALSAYLSAAHSSAQGASPQVVPMVDTDKTPLADVERRYTHVLKAGAAKVDVMQELDHVMSVAPPRAQR